MKILSKKIKATLLILTTSLIVSAQPFPCTLTNCAGTIVNEPYSSAAGWTNLSSGKMNIASGTMNYLGVGDVPGPLRMYKNYPAISPHSYGFVAEFSASINLSPALTFCPEHYLLCLSNNAGEPKSTNNDALFVMLNSVYNVPGTLYFQLAYKDAMGPVVFSATSIPLPGAGLYYFRVIKRDVNYQLYVSTDPAFGSFIPGAPIHMYVCPLVNNLNYVQHGRYDTDIKRKLGAKIDDLKICPYTGGCAFGPSPCRVAGNSISENVIGVDKVQIFPNPAQNNFEILLPDAEDEILQAQMVDATGKIIIIDYVTAEGGKLSFAIKDIPQGIYFIKLIGKNQTYTSKISIQQ